MDHPELEATIEEYRHKHESGVEWRLRKTFMLTHMDKYPLDRLLCLAACFINYECYGCTYPGPVMIELKELMEELSDVLEDHRNTITKARQLQFIKSSGENFESYSSSLKAAKRKSTDDAPGPSSSVQKDSGGGKKKHVSFVKASDSYQSTDTGESKTEETSSHDEDAPWRPKLSFSGAGADGGGGVGGFHGMQGVKQALREHEATVEEETRSELLDKFYTLKAILPECLRKTKDHLVSALHMAADRSKLTIMTKVTPSETDPGHFECLLQIDCVDVAAGTAQNKKLAKNNAYDQAIVEFREPYLKIVKDASGGQILEGSQAPFGLEGLASPAAHHFGVKAKLLETGLTGLTKLGQATSGNITALAKGKGTKRQPVDWNRPLEEFLILRTQQHSGIDDSFRATNVLRQSCDFNKMSLDYDFRHDSVMGESRVRCLVSVQGTVVAEVEEMSVQSAKHLASQECLEKLQQFCWTLQIKQAADSSESGLSREEVLGDIEKSAAAIPDSNIGSKLLKAMGWKGGGVGKDGTGIAEPVKVESVINREGLGLKSSQGIKTDFLPAIRNVIMNYTKSDKQSDLVFSPKFTKDERAVIHRECQKLGLKTRSTGVGDERYLIASRRRTPNQLFEHIMQQGGETSKYVLIPPSGGGEIRF